MRTIPTGRCSRPVAPRALIAPDSYYMRIQVKLTTLIEDVLYRIIHNAYDKTAAIKLVKLSIPTYSGIAV